MLTTVFSDQDPLTAIEARLSEVKMMSKPRRDERHVLDRISPKQKALVLVS